MVYLHLFGTENEFSEEYYGSGYTEPWVSYTLETSAVNYNNNTIPLQETPFTIQFIDSNHLSADGLGAENLEYRLNGGQWTQFPMGDFDLDVSAGDEISLKGTYNQINTLVQYQTNRMNVYGNIMSIDAGDGFESATTVNNGFFGLFQDWSGLISAENLLLPATALTSGCYRYMFFGCSSLASAPALPATAMTEECYDFMFFNCSSLTSAPALPATTLANTCYHGMFSTCTGLTSAPELPALTLVDDCYANMFEYCSSLNYIKCLATNIQANSCTDSWVAGVSGSGTFVKNPSMASWPSGDSGIPSGWTTQNG